MGEFSWMWLGLLPMALVTSVSFEFSDWQVWAYMVAGAWLYLFGRFSNG